MEEYTCVNREMRAAPPVVLCSEQWPLNLSLHTHFVYRIAILQDRARFSCTGKSKRQLRFKLRQNAPIVK